MGGGCGDFKVTLDETDGNIFCSVIYNHHDRRDSHVRGLAYSTPLPTSIIPPTLASSTYIAH